MTAARILVVEDDFLIRLALADALEEAGFAVLEAATADAALDLLRADPAIALMVTDIALPEGVDGRELATRARALSPDLPVITTTGQPQHYADSALPDLERFFAKPYQPTELCMAVREMIARRRPLPAK